MNDRSTTIVPRRRRGEPAPAAPLDPYVTKLLRWIASHEQGVSFTALSRQASAAMDWPTPFAEAIVTAARSRRLLTLIQTTSRGSYRAGISKRGREWLERGDAERA